MARAVTGTTGAPTEEPPVETETPPEAPTETPEGDDAVEGDE